MANPKFSELPEVTDVQATDDFPMARAGDGKRITGASLTELFGDPDWWTVDSTPTEESVTMAGKIVLDPVAGHDGDVPILMMEGNKTDMVDVSNYGIFWGARMSGGSGNWDTDYIYRAGVHEFRFRSAEDEGAASLWVEAFDTTRKSRLVDGGLYLYPDYEGDGAPSMTITIDTLGFFGESAIVQQTGVAVTAAAIHAALVNYGLITA